MEAFTLLKYWKAGVTARLPLSATILDSDADDNDDGPFFDLEFAVPKDNNNIHLLDPQIQEIIDDDDDDEEADLDSDTDLFFKSRIVRIDGSEDDTSKSGQFPIPVSLLRSATKFRVFMLGLKRSKSQLFKVTFKIASTDSGEDPAAADPESGEEKRNNKKEVIQKYLKLVNPRSIRVSKEAGEENTGVGRKGLNLKGIMNKNHLGKSKSAVVYSSAQQNVGTNKRDDSLLQQQDGIQGAILHCKRSFNSSSPESEEREALKLEAGLMLTRSASDPSYEKKRTMTVVSEAEAELTREEKKANEVVSGS